MAEMNISQGGFFNNTEENLQVLDETFTSLLDQLPSISNITSEVPTPNLTVAEEFPPVEHLPGLSTTFKSDEQLVHYPSTFPQQHIPSALPASQNWLGDYGFTVSFNPQENVKGATWIYSEAKNKLYVGKDVPCPINFSTRCVMPDNVFIRAMALFSSVDHSADLVHRCVNHSMDEIQKGVKEAEHLIRCESKMACYHTDPVTGRHSVTVPFENPAAGQNFSSYLYKFLCFGSCSGGPNRRPLMLIFTLEKGYEVIGRQRVDLKICACPARDKRLEEQQLFPDKNKQSVKRKKDPTIIASTLTPDLVTSCLPVKKSKVSPNKDGYYIVKVRDENCYRFLKEMKKFYYMKKTLQQINPADVSCLVYSSLSSDEAECNKNI